MVEHTRQMPCHYPGAIAAPAGQRCANSRSEACVRNFAAVKCFAAQCLPLNLRNFRETLTPNVTTSADLRRYGQLTVSNGHLWRADFA
jgi:hypothetical protein